MTDSIENLTQVYNEPPPNDTNSTEFVVQRPKDPVYGTANSIDNIMHTAAQRLEEQPDLPENVSFLVSEIVDRVINNPVLADLRRQVQARINSENVAGKTPDRAKICSDIVESHMFSHRSNSDSDDFILGDVFSPLNRLGLSQREMAYMEVFRSLGLPIGEMSYGQFMDALSSNTHYKNFDSTTQMGEHIQETNIAGVRLRVGFTRGINNAKGVEKTIDLDLTRPAMEDIILNGIDETFYTRHQSETKAMVEAREALKTQDKNTLFEQRRNDLGLSGNPVDVLNRVIFEAAQALPAGSPNHDIRIRELRQLVESAIDGPEIREMRHRMALKRTEIVNTTSGSEPAPEYLYGQTAESGPLRVGGQFRIVPGEDELAESLFRQMGIIDDATSWSNFVSSELWTHPRNEINRERLEPIRLQTAIEGITLVATPQGNNPEDVHFVSFELNEGAKRAAVLHTSPTSEFAARENAEVTRKSEMSNRLARAQELIRVLDTRIGSTPETTGRFFKKTNPAYEELKTQREQAVTIVQNLRRELEGEKGRS